MGSRFPRRVVCNAEEFTNSRTSLVKAISSKQTALTPIVRK